MGGQLPLLAGRRLKEAASENARVMGTQVSGKGGVRSTAGPQRQGVSTDSFLQRWVE